MMHSLEKCLEKHLMDMGKKLIFPIYSVGELLRLLDGLAYNLSKVWQVPSQSMQDALRPAMRALIAPELLKHMNTNVRVSVASCICEILRITAPTLPYNDEQMTEVFHLLVATFGTLSPENSCYFKSLSILENVAKIRLCMEMLDLECDALIIEMFQHFLTISKFHCSDATFANMEAIMTMVLEESDDISKELLYPLLDSVRKENKNVGSLSWQLGEQVLTNCAEKLKLYLMEAVQSLGSVLDDYAPIVISICKDRARVNFVKATPMDYSPWESMMKLLPDMSAKLNAQPQSDLTDEPEPMPQGVVSFPNLILAKDVLEGNIEVVTDNSKVEEMIMQEFQQSIEALKVPNIEEEGLPQENLVLSKVDDIVFAFELLEVQGIDFLGVDKFELATDRCLIEFFAKLKILLRVAHFEVELTQRLKQLAYSKYLFIWNGRIQYLHQNSNSRSSFSHPGRVDGDSMHMVQPSGPIQPINLKT